MAGNSVLVSFSSLNVHQNIELNPDAPEYIPIQLHKHHSAINTTTTTTSSAFLHYYHHQPYLIPPTPPPPPPAYVYVSPSFYFQPLIRLNPQPHFTSIIPRTIPQHQLTWSQRCIDQTHESDGIDRSGRIAAGNGSGWRRLRRGKGADARVWKVKNGRRSSTSEYPVNRRIVTRSDANRAALTSSSAIDSHLKEETSEWRTVKYRACKKLGKMFEIRPVDKSAKNTTVMIRNIPSRYTRETMLTFLDRHCMQVNQKLKQMCSATDEVGCCNSAYDFFYMPIDFKTELNKSYAFVNFTTPEAVWRFHTECDSQKWELFESKKIRQIALAKLQGTGELIEHFGRTAFACDQDEFLPVHFQPPRDGSADADRATIIIGKRVS